jgi:hypothetical protein
MCGSHGYLSISLDGAAKQYINGYSHLDDMQAELWSANVTTGAHGIIITNEMKYKPTAGEVCASFPF